MRKKNMKKKIACLLLSIVIGIEPCFATKLIFTNIQKNEGNQDKDKYIETDWQNYILGDKKYQYSYKYYIDSLATISVNAYNLDGTSIIPKNTKIDRDKFTFKAGTWIGINVSEHKLATWGVKDLEYQEITTEYICHYTEQAHYDKNTTIETNNYVPEEVCNGMASKKSWRPLYPGAELGKCYYYAYDKGGDKKTIQSAECRETYNTNYKLTKTEPIEVIKTTEIPDKVKENIKTLVIDTIAQQAKDIVSTTSGVVQYMTNNSYPKKTTDATYGYIDNGKEIKNDVKEESEPKEENGEITGSIEKEHEFLQNKVCMNLKTSIISYGRDCKEEDGETPINNGTIYDKYLNEYVNYWHYFIPLNTTSNSEFTLDIIKNTNQKFDIKTCKNFIEENIETYQDLIIPYGDFGTFVGDYGRYEDKNLSIDLKTLNDAGGCNISTKIKFPISQEFYRETDNNTLKGFNFYYKPIDINNPFPNELASTSLWSNWYDDELDLSESFNKRTYITSTINVNAIREYNKNNPYTEWKNSMYTNGVSKFIETEGIVTRLVKNDSFYKLGCGPANEAEYLDAAKKVKNIKYLERCDAS